MVDSSIRSDDLDRVDLSEIDGSEVAVGWEAPEPPPRRRGRAKQPSKWVALVALADSATAVHDGTRPAEIDGHEAQVGPWIHYPTSNEPIVPWYRKRALEKAFGPGSEYQEANGAYFEVTLRETVRKKNNTEKGGGNTYGVLYIRKVIPKAAK